MALAYIAITWWRHQMETFSALRAICAGIHRSPVKSPHKGQWRGALMFSLICARTNGWVNNREAGDLRRHRSRCDVIVMITSDSYWVMFCIWTWLDEQRTSIWTNSHQPSFLTPSSDSKPQSVNVFGEKIEPFSSNISKKVVRPSLMIDTLNSTEHWRSSFQQLKKFVAFCSYLMFCIIHLTIESLQAYQIVRIEMLIPWRLSTRPSALSFVT